ncbi:LytR/AlgR family response regulator transcription factor [Pedobacter sp. NJ-S-72]
MILNCVIIEDENHAIELLTDHIQSMPNLSLLKVYSQPITAMTEITEEDNIDIIFLDINMPGMSGMDLAKILRPKDPLFNIHYSISSICRRGL